MRIDGRLQGGHRRGGEKGSVNTGKGSGHAFHQDEGGPGQSEGEPSLGA